MKNGKNKAENSAADNIKNILVRFNYGNTVALTRHKIIRDYENVGELFALFLAVLFFICPMIAVWVLGEPSDEKDLLVYICIAAATVFVVLALFLTCVKKLRYIRKADRNEIVAVRATIADINEKCDKASEHYECIITLNYGEGNELKVRMETKRNHEIKPADTYLLFATDEDGRESTPFLIYMGEYTLPADLKIE